MLVSLHLCKISGSGMMSRKLVVVSLLLTLALSGCSYFSHKDPASQQAATLKPLAAPTLVEQKILPMSCDDHCFKHGGIKKKFCLKKCEYKKRKTSKDKH